MEITVDFYSKTVTVHSERSVAMPPRATTQRQQSVKITSVRGRLAYYNADGQTLSLLTPAKLKEFQKEQKQISVTGISRVQMADVLSTLGTDE